MTTKDEALRMALEALESCSAGDYSTGHVIHQSFDVNEVNMAITAIREALAEQPAQQEPLQDFESSHAKALMFAYEEGWRNCADAEFIGEEAQNDAFNSSITLSECINADRAKQPAQQQEPVQTEPNFEQRKQILDNLERCHHRDSKHEFLRTWIRYWTNHKLSKQPPRKPLTDEEIWDEVKAADLDWQTGWSLDEDAPNRYITFARAIEAAHGITGEQK